jgi:hypothetical protein
MDLECIPVQTQRQDSAAAQLSDLRLVASRLGMYDAADAISQIFKLDLVDSVVYACHYKIGVGEPVDITCVIDIECHYDCIYAEKGMRREQCEYWRIVSN